MHPEIIQLMFHMNTKYLREEQIVVSYIVLNGPSTFVELQIELEYSDEELYMYLLELVNQKYLLKEVHNDRNIYWVNEDKLVEILMAKPD